MAGKRQKLVVIMTAHTIMARYPDGRLQFLVEEETRFFQSLWIIFRFVIDAERAGYLLQLDDQTRLPRGGRS